MAGEFYGHMNSEPDSLAILLDGSCLSINTYLKENEDNEKNINDRSINCRNDTGTEH